MTDTSLVMASVRHNVALYVALRDLPTEGRVTYLIDHLNKTVELATDSPKEIDNYLQEQFETLSRALIDAEFEGINATRRCASIAADLFTKCTVPIALALPKTIDQLCAKIVTCWASVPGEAEASLTIITLGELYLSTTDRDRHHAINRAVNKVRDECPRLRLAHAMIALDSLTDWDYSDEGNIYDAVAFNLMRSQRKTNLRAMRRMAHLEIVNGETLSDVAEKALLESAASIKRIDDLAQWLCGYLNGDWRLGAIDVANKSIKLCLNVDSPAEGPVANLLHDTIIRMKEAPKEGDLHVTFVVTNDHRVLQTRESVSW